MKKEYFKIIWKFGWGVWYNRGKDISIEELNLHYNIVDSVETQAQVQNMLFFGNVSKPIERDPDLQDMSLYIKAQPQLGESVGYVDPETYTVGSNVDIYNNEYYSPLNIYYNLL